MKTLIRISKSEVSYHRFSSFIFSNNFYLIFAAWLCYGIASALDSGTLDAYIINQLKMAHREDDLRKFLALNNRLEIVGLLLGSSLGGVLYLSIGINIYVSRYCLFSGFNSCDVFLFQ